MVDIYSLLGIFLVEYIPYWVYASLSSYTVKVVNTAGLKFSSISFLCHQHCCNFSAHFIDLVSYKSFPYEFNDQLMMYALCPLLDREI